MHPTTMKILVVEDNPGDARLLVEAFKEEGKGAFEITWADTLAAGLAAAGQTPFDAALLDLNLPDGSGLQTYLTFHSSYPGLPVVLLTGLEDEGLGLRAVQEGAQDYLVKGQTPPSAIARSLRFAVERNRSLEWHRSKSRHAAAGRTIAFLGVKGGVGTTTLAVNAAAVLAHDRLVIAAELRGSYGSFATHFRKLTPNTLVDLFEMTPAEITETQIEQRLVNSQLGFYLLFGPRHAGEICQPGAEHLSRISSRLTNMADTVVLDLPPILGEGYAAVLRSASAVTLVSERDDCSVTAAQVTVERLRKWGVPNEVMSLALVNRTPIMDGISKDKIEELLRVHVCGTVPPSPDLCVAAYKSGVPISVFRPRSAPAGIMTEIARHAEHIAAGHPVAVPA